MYNSPFLSILTDAPLGPIRPTIASIEQLSLSETDQRKLFAGNAAKLLKMDFA